jgi:ATP-dependent DNA helicase RecQ
MFRFAEAGRCRHQLLAEYFGETLQKCGESCDVCRGKVTLPPKLRKSRRGSEGPSRSAAVAAALGASVDGDLLTLLKSLRLHLARENGVPAYLIFNDATLLEMAARKPRSEAELLQVSGVGPAKLEKYGAAFLKMFK